VTSLLNNPHWFADSVVFWKNWWAQKQSPQGDLSQDIELDVQLDQNNKMYIDIHNNAMNTYIWKVYYNFWDDVDIKTCVWSTQDELVLDIIQWDSVIWKIAINLQNHTHIVSRSIQQTLTNKRINKNSIIAVWVINRMEKW